MKTLQKKLKTFLCHACQLLGKLKGESVGFNQSRVSCPLAVEHTLLHQGYKTRIKYVFARFSRAPASCLGTYCKKNGLEV